MALGYSCSRAAAAAATATATTCDDDSNAILGPVADADRSLLSLAAAAIIVGSVGRPKILSLSLSDCIRLGGCSSDLEIPRALCENSRRSMALPPPPGGGGRRRRLF
jgi:hypothetical protein